MKRTDITALFPDATPDQIDKLMDLNGGDINRAKGELDGLKTQLTSAQEELAALKAAAPEKDKLKEATDRAEALQAELDGIKKANEAREMRDKVAKETGLPVDMMEFLTGADEEACLAQAKKLVERIKAGGYPKVKDPGEARTPGITKADILAIKNERERLKAIREHIDLF